MKLNFICETCLNPNDISVTTQSMLNEILSAHASIYYAYDYQRE